MTPEQIVESETRAQLASLYLTLMELQKSSGYTDDNMRKNIEYFESNFSNIEEQDDISISTLSRYIQTLGGSLKLVADFPDKEIVLSQFD
ncbi:MAG TPA: transcriptional regulator [Cyanobacteria bacterium UBA11149]|nr:transcriptional regulator [Cyanobacteria bacterium UBA11367]HBE60792.1 transcriptional regulator [Cyanobacteria bacterium UBA11366]HBK66421.1 transcriptional regulator [Cyanobacteria bacterium UBA11166]HBR73646.1 transcriptional regulator [Cyanobacteria bacterium UBA11159]HBS72197.1 transcriptional regulator [Cyanobacteria bacterium UBA11153]HBW90269.1 transcriptional regulator [Cyanobacteria bacterium UBA11149]HCA98199.1 transcriptional regulator [Cyanobacteria bacterium UBA9226]